MYPMLLLWGVQDRCTAAIASEISKLVAMLGSLEEVEQVLSDRGQPLDFKTIRTIAYRFAARARAAQRVGSLNWGETVAGRRVVVSTDGGRIRIRTTKRGPKTAKGRNRYRTDWREPKLLIIYVVDEKGQMDREFLAVIDGTLGGPDAIFKLIEFYLRELKIATADKVLFVADGARWIWNRVGALLRRLGVKPDQVNELVDFYHAVEHLGKIAALQRRWTAAERQAWIGRQRRRLLKGGVEEVQAAIDAVCGSRPGKALKRERDYFKRNGGKGRMDYARMAALKLPIGSGAIESAIRRVVNLRLKGPSIYWHKTSAEAVLLLRSYYKAGRWNHLEKTSTYDCNRERRVSRTKWIAPYSTAEPCVILVPFGYEPSWFLHRRPILMLSVFCSPSRYTQGKDATASLGREMMGLGLRGPVLLVAGRSAIQRLSETWERTFREADINHTVHPFSGECSLVEIERVKAAARQAKAQVIVGAGGGKVLDTARAVAAGLDLPVVNCPTVASSDAPCSALSVIYTEEAPSRNTASIGRIRTLCWWTPRLSLRARPGCWWPGWGMPWRHGSKPRPALRVTSATCEAGLRPGAPWRWRNSALGPCWRTVPRPSWPSTPRWSRPPWSAWWRRIPSFPGWGSSPRGWRPPMRFTTG